MRFHLFFNRHQLFIRNLDICREFEVIIEAGLDGRSDGHFGAGIELLHGGRHQVGRRMAQDIQGLGRLAGDDGYARGTVQRMAQVDQLAVHFAGQGGFRQTGANAGGHLAHGASLLQLLLGTVG
jgi:hypothetical protein